MSWCLCQGLEQCFVCTKSTQESVVITTILFLWYITCFVKETTVLWIPCPHDLVQELAHTQIKLKNTTSFLWVINWDVQIYDASEFKNNHWKNYVQVNSEITNKKELMKTGEDE